MSPIISRLTGRSWMSSVSRSARRFAATLWHVTSDTGASSITRRPSRSRMTCQHFTSVRPITSSNCVGCKLATVPSGRSMRSVYGRVRDQQTGPPIRQLAGRYRRRNQSRPDEGSEPKGCAGSAEKQLSGRSTGDMIADIGETDCPVRHRIVIGLHQVALGHDRKFRQGPGLHLLVEGSVER